MIIKNKKEIALINYGKKAIQIIYKAGKVVWQAVRSCFGSGAWRNEKPWINNEGWKNEN